MPEQKIGVGIIGIEPKRSWGATAHVPALQALSDRYEIVVVCNSRQESADRAADAFGIPRAFDSANQLAACDAVDLVTVTVKVPHHLDLVRRALAAGKHVYCEWPLGNGIEEAREMATLARERGVVAVCGMQARSLPSSPTSATCSRRAISVTSCPCR